MSFIIQNAKTGAKCTFTQEPKSRKWGEAGRQSFRIDCPRDDDNVVVWPLIEAVKNGNPVVMSDEPMAMRIAEFAQYEDHFEIELVPASPAIRKHTLRYGHIEETPKVETSNNDLWTKMHQLLFANAPS